MQYWAVRAAGEVKGWEGVELRGGVWGKGCRTLAWLFTATAGATIGL